MSSVSNLLAEMAERGLSIELVGADRLRVRGPKAACRALASRVIANKSGLLAALTHSTSDDYGQLSEHGLVCALGHIDLCYTVKGLRLCHRCIAEGFTPENVTAELSERNRLTVQKLLAQAG